MEYKLFGMLLNFHDNKIKQMKSELKLLMLCMDLLYVRLLTLHNGDGKIDYKSTQLAINLNMRALVQILSFIHSIYLLIVI